MSRKAGTVTNLGIPIAPVTKVTTPSTEATLKCCPINNTFNFVGKRFAILILRNMINSKQNRFNQLLNSIEDCNPKTLSVRLRVLRYYDDIFSVNSYRFQQHSWFPLIASVITNS
ncbi:MAG TPA: winged helix-turn-helix transcriptional regulator [Candidatus Bathyarchaeia archaeon]|nr:winged helix-turn-helix transcriptional regulator [Candidatus Bathyarchaeia archaeon]